MGAKISTNLLYQFKKKKSLMRITPFSVGKKIKITEYIQIKRTRTIILPRTP